MADFPPNLEDAEKWLPLDIYEDIFSEFDFKPKSEVKTTQNFPMKVETFDHGGNKEFHVNHGKTKGTGVFIPKMTIPIYDPRSRVFHQMTQKYDPITGVCKGTGVYIPSMVADALVTVPENQANGMKDKVIQGIHILEENSTAKKETFQPSSDIWFPKIGSTCISK